MKDPGDDSTEDRDAQHYEPGGARSGRGLLDRGQSRHEGVGSRHEGVDTEEGAEEATLFYVKRKIGRGKGRESVKRRPRAWVESGGIDIIADTPDIGESSPGGAKSVKGWMLSSNTTKRVGGLERVAEPH